MKVLMLWKYYPQYLSYFYEKYPYVVDLPFQEHRNAMLNDHFGWPGDLSRYMNNQGIETEFIIVNAESMQKQWARENNFESYSDSGWEKEIAMEQIKRFKPDILWITAIFDYFGDFIKDASAHCKKVITWVSCATPDNLDLSGLEVLVTSHPEMLKDKQHLFNEVVVVKPGFDSEILKKIGNVEKKYDVTFVGSITANHLKRAETLAYLIENGIDLKFFGNVGETPKIRKDEIIKQVGKYVSSLQNIRKGIHIFRDTYLQTSQKHNDYQRHIETIKKVYQGPVFGMKMYRTLAASHITLNIHIDVAGDHAGNMRMFETTGVGTCLLTEYSENINDLFEPGKEVLTYISKEDLLSSIKKSLEFDECIESVAKAGQEKTLNDHSIERMFTELECVFDIE
ncbi:glycosyltransferase [Methanolobus sp. ZRKC2]|uniref:glycosyltransferase family protein n=1 Tax=Methanolobus sp. ZRKC2 TaxID=3125783 RepID=UPI003255371D